MTPNEAVERARELLDLKWTHDDQVQKVADVVQAIAEKLDTPEDFLRTAQVLWLPHDAGGVKGRPSARRILAHLQQKLTTLVQDSALGWAQTVSWAALQCHAQNVDAAAATLALFRSSAEWIRLEQRYQSFLMTFINEISDKAEVSYQERMNVRAYHETSVTSDEQDAYAGDGAESEIMIEATVTSVESYLARSSRVFLDEINLLWWGQSLYSPNLRMSYRDIPKEHVLFWLVEDMSQLGNPWPSEAKTAYSTETLRKLVASIDERMPVSEHAKQLIGAVAWGTEAASKAVTRALPAWMRALIDEEPTGLPISYLVIGALARTAPDQLLDGLKAQIGMDLEKSISVRQWASWIYRERCLGRFLDEGWTKAAG